jgi:hypothetical protein
VKVKVMPQQEPMGRLIPAQELLTMAKSLAFGPDIIKLENVTLEPGEPTLQTPEV